MTAADRLKLITSDQFHLQHHHFTTRFPNTDFWIVEQDVRLAGGCGGGGGRAARPIGRFYLNRTESLWRTIDLGLTPGARGQA